MPALVTHFLFGEELLHHIDPRVAATDRQRDAFLLGCQGPDPFLFALTTSRGATVRSMGPAMHRRSVSAAFDRLREDARLLPDDMRSIGESFLAGVLAHYVLDRTAHPFVYAHEFELCDYNAELADAYHEVHALIESELDSGMLDHLRGISTLQLPPVSVLEADDEVLLAAGTLLAQCGRTVYGLDLRPTDYPGAVADMRRCYRTIEPYDAQTRRRIARLERVARPHSMLSALSHRADLKADNPSMNMGHLAWDDPFKEGTSRESFPEVFARAVNDYLGAFDLYAHGVPSTSFVEGLDYNGKPLDEREQPLGSIHPL